MCFHHLQLSVQDLVFTLLTPIKMLTLSRARFEELLTIAKRAYEKEEEDGIIIKMIDEEANSGKWREVAKKAKRPLSGVVVERGVKERLERDIVEFCQSQEWYLSRGVPWRRGFLFHGEFRLFSVMWSQLKMYPGLTGVPGSGKTSLIHALASACGLNIFVVSLATAG